MMPTPIHTDSLTLVPQSRDEVRARIARMPPPEKVNLSPAWLEMLESSSPVDPWIHGFTMVCRNEGRVVGSCGFKGPPGADGIVEIAYGVTPENQGRGFATEAAQALVAAAWTCANVHTVRAHTLAELNASTRVLTKCGFVHVGKVFDPDDGWVWRWERHRTAD